MVTAAGSERSDGFQAASQAHALQLGAHLLRFFLAAERAHAHARDVARRRFLRVRTDTGLLQAFAQFVDLVLVAERRYLQHEFLAALGSGSRLGGLAFQDGQRAGVLRCLALSCWFGGSARFGSFRFRRPGFSELAFGVGAGVRLGLGFRLRLGQLALGFTLALLLGAAVA